MKNFLIIIISIILIHIAAVETVAQTNGITVIPSIMRLDLAEDQPEYKIVYKNNTKNTVILAFRAQDFTELEDGWKINFLEAKDAKNYRYSLSSWVNFNKSSLTLSPGEMGEITVKIDENELSPGGHYASVFAEIEQQDQSNNTGAKNILPLHGILSSLVFVRAHTDNEVEDASITAFKPTQEWFGFPFQFIFRFKNSGNVDLVPHGTIKIYDPFSNLVSKTAVNEESFITLPESIRRYDIIGFNSNPLLIPGMYRAELALHFGKNNNEPNYNISFFTLGTLPYLPILFILIGLYVAKIFLFKIYKIKLPNFLSRSKK